MTASLRMLHQRSRGELLLTAGKNGIVRLREAGSIKLRMPRGSNEAILINTGGGLAGGDEFGIDLKAEANASLTVTTQAAERVYRTLGPPATVRVRLTAEPGSRLIWLPQETILFDGSGLVRSLDAEVVDSATLLAVESVVFGRREMGETVTSCRFRDRWRIRRNGKPVFADDTAFDGPPPASRGALEGAGAMALVVKLGDDCESRIDAAREIIGANGGASAWSGKLVARLLAEDGFALRKRLVPLLRLLLDGRGLPKLWSL